MPPDRRIKLFNLPIPTLFAEAARANGKQPPIFGRILLGSLAQACGSYNSSHAA
jgi:hypothetical protein